MFKIVLGILIFCGKGNTEIIKHPELPSYIKVCHQKDPKLNECIKESVELMRPELVKGIPEFEIPSLEPLCIPKVELNQGGAGPVSFKATFTDVKVHGPSKFILRSVKTDLDKDRVRIKLTLPQLRVVSNYSMEGRILMMPISGQGISTGNYSDIDATVLIQAQRRIKNDETYFHVKDLFIDFLLTKAEIKLSNLFNGDEKLGNTMNMFLNDNWKNVANEITPILEDSIAALFKKLSNKIFHKFPMSVVLPP